MKTPDAGDPGVPVVLALRPPGLGDLLTALPALRALRRWFESHHLVLATSPRVGALAEWLGVADRVMAASESGPLPIQLEKDDFAFNLHGRGPESTYRLIGAGASKLVAFAHPDIPATYGSAPWRRDEHEVSRWSRLLDHFGISVDPDDLLVERPPSLPLGREDLRGCVVIHPGAAFPARRWPPERWSNVARRLSARGAVVVLTGDITEKGLCREIAGAAGLPAHRVLAGRTGVLDLSGIIAHANLFLSADTGPAHLASAFSTPSVILFGPTSPSQWGPPSQGPHVGLWKGRSGDPRADSPDPGLLEITVEEVLEAAGNARLLPRPEPPQIRARTTQ